MTGTAERSPSSDSLRPTCGQKALVVRANPSPSEDMYGCVGPSSGLGFMLYPSLQKWPNACNLSSTQAPSHLETPM